VDDFSGTSLNTQRWDIYDSPDGSPRRSPDLVAVKGGELLLSGTVNGRGQEVGAGIGDRLSQRYGRWEARVRVDHGSGYSEVVLLWPTSERWPDDGEIDMLEVPRAERTLGYTVLHNGPENSQEAKSHLVDFSAWHTVAVDWMPSYVTFWLDSKPVWTYTPPTNPAQHNLIPSTSPMRFALQLDACTPAYGGWIPCRNASTPPTVTMHVDWVKVYKPQRKASSSDQ
jgi:beta-glucanase (GH16 family)